MKKQLIPILLLIAISSAVMAQSKSSGPSNTGQKFVQPAFADRKGYDSELNKLTGDYLKKLIKKQVK
ncbi:MAG TPA: hypothetical protein VGN00_05290 [Puia sp.]|jgi:hypothetical protein